MNNKDRLLDLLASCGITEDYFFELAYRTLIDGLFETICKDIRKDHKEQVERSRFMGIGDKKAATISILRRRCPHLSLSDEELTYLIPCFVAFFNRSPRKEYDQEKKRNLFLRQKKCCSICGTQITFDSSEVDHKLAYSLVGDNLENNYQLLCKICNSRKGDSSSYQFSVLLTHRNI